MSLDQDGRSVLDQLRDSLNLPGTQQQDTAFIKMLVERPAYSQLRLCLNRAFNRGKEVHLREVRDLMSLEQELRDSILREYEKIA